ncbi:Glycine/D-amino acid oxidase [Cribrihabitans marinus]|uniref:Glycine/D-amino acid oxidase n=1 Tax=Cribrihabitans marinus TaxID=1227549 RepID=A0A1H6Y3S4_9RHOB|nr:FAD-binding oxidoreductase [Cribrihabitans marinus]GGH27949.1 oxidoreductase [Cribrihabitans marinus]SEJ31812.1 Glycine/D-amino acid oxidase [Cribrihabitans marinus]
MRRIFPEYAYGPGPRLSCWWDETVDAPDWPVLREQRRVDVGIVGGGYTGLSAALRLAERGASVAVVEAGPPGWGASGRNGGFCCLGGSKLSAAAMTRRHGPEAAAEYQRAERAAVDLVADLIARHGIAADRHSQGETVLAHSRRAWRRLRSSGEDAELHDKVALARLGLGHQFHGGMTRPVGFALNPRKFLFGLAHAARNAGAEIYGNSPAVALERVRGGHAIGTDQGLLACGSVLICTNGYSSEDLPPWLAGRYMPTQSSVMVTRPLTETELAKAGWTSAQMAYDTRHLLHYFRLMPDRRFLFGMRGGLRASPGSEAAIRTRLRRDFDRMFPDWAHVEATHSWSGLVCLARNLVPFVGAVPHQPGVFAAFAYHGNGVAMGSFCGRALADHVLGAPEPAPRVMTTPPGRFPLGRYRRAIMPPAYMVLGLLDRL